MATYVFPGQGSQKKGMGGTLFDEFPELTKQADQILGYSIKELCLEDPGLKLSQTQYTQPALFVVNAFSYLKKIDETGKKPDFVAGHSLGEFNALFAAGVFDFETGLKLVKKRGELMSRATGGGMAAVIGLNEEQVTDVLQRHHLQSICIANLNSPFQIVISGPKDDVDNAKAVFEGVKEVKLFTPLKTSGAFHSRYMEEAKQEFAKFIHPFVFEKPAIPVIANVSARPYKPSEISENLIEQITHPVKWTESIRYLLGLGEMEFEELGPGKVLTGLITRIKNEAAPLIVHDENESIPSHDKPTIPQKTEKTGAASSPTTAGEGQNNQTMKTSSAGTPRKTSKTAKTVKDKNQCREMNAVSPMSLEITAQSLGSPEFKNDYNLKYAYLTGGMYRGIASKEMVVKMGKAGMMGFFGTGGLTLSQIEEAIRYIQKELSGGQAYGMNLVCNLNDPAFEEKTVDLFLETGVRTVEAAAFLNITPALVKYRVKGLTRDKNGKTKIFNRIIAKVSRPEVAEAFLSPAPERILEKLLQENKITPEEAELSKKIPMADDICAEADSGGHTDGGVAYALMPAMLKLRDDMMEKYQYPKKIRLGAAGGIGTPAAAAAAFMLGADFILTGSINQCTVEAATSDAVKDLLEHINVQDTDYAPAGDMFELGAKVQVLKHGVFFPARANKLYDLYRQYNSIDEIDEKTKTQIQEKYFKRDFNQVYEDIKAFYPASEIERAERNPKQKMALIFKWYFGYSTRLALSGSEESKVDYQVHCGPALGAFNQWVKGTPLEKWRCRHVDEIGVKIMNETAELFKERFNTFLKIR